LANLTKVWVDSSHRSGDCLCQSGFIFHDQIKNKSIRTSSEVFTAENNNDSEILGIYYALKAIYEKHNITNFKVYNDSIVACQMLCGSREISQKTLNKFPVLQFVREYFEANGISVRTEQVNRTNRTIKICDRFSKVFRHKEKKYDTHGI